LFASRRVPALTVVLPVNVFAPPRISVPVPALVSPDTDPAAITPLYVVLPVPVTVRRPAVPPAASAVLPLNVSRPVPLLVTVNAPRNWSVLLNVWAVVTVLLTVTAPLASNRKASPALPEKV